MNIEMSTKCTRPDMATVFNARPNNKFVNVQDGMFNMKMDYKEILYKLKGILIITVYTHITCGVHFRYCYTV